MKEKIIKAAAELKKAGKTSKGVSFKHQSNVPGKEVRGKLFYNKLGGIEMRLTRISGYNENYISATARSALREAVLPIPQSGDVVWTKYSGSPNPGTTYILSGSSYYYAVGNGRIDCNGRRFYDDTSAVFLHDSQGSCSPGISNNYKLFRLI